MTVRESVSGTFVCYKHPAQMSAREDFTEFSLRKILKNATKEEKLFHS